uniref:Uncharacterized protein n=1 Tax=Anguilla anguilla TaxID=7936 RepID=A0A0E9RJQ1_ANGAN
MIKYIIINEKMLIILRPSYHELSWG